MLWLIDICSVIASDDTRSNKLFSIFSLSSGGLGAKRRICAEAILHVQKPHENPEQIERKAWS